MRIAVAGCAGFIGYHLTERLLREGAAVVGLDDLSSGQQANVTDLKAAFPQFTFVQQDVSKAIAVEGGFDFVYDLACPASPADFKSKSMHILAVCSQGVWNLLDLARRSKARFFHASTSEVYGDPLEHPQREEYWGHVNTIGERACYDEGKRFAEALISSYRRAHGLETRMARIFNTYGPRMRNDDGRALPNFITQALHGEPITIHGDGSQTRSFCYVDDLVDGLIRLSRSDCAEPVNIGNPEEITILEFARELIAMTGSKSRIEFVGRPQDDPNRRKPDISRARRVLGWEPRVSRQEGLRRTVEWFMARGV
ncbi:MAG: SDR family oxidoreductase [Deltaproteobacteria bacterium]|nr:SDR family oxidoreductase [Deltaproteobacteria bacterium]